MAYTRFWEIKNLSDCMQKIQGFQKEKKIDSRKFFKIFFKDIADNLLR